MCFLPGAAEKAGVNFDMTVLYFFFSFFKQNYYACSWIVVSCRMWINPQTNPNPKAQHKESFLGEKVAEMQTSS